MTVDPRLTEGIHLFNTQKFFESHEVIERLWLEVKGDTRNFYKGLIQAAAALYHFDRGNFLGARGLFKTSTEYLSKYGPKFMGVNLEKLIRDLQACFKERTLQENLIPTIEFLPN